MFAGLGAARIRKLFETAREERARDRLHRRARRCRNASDSCSGGRAAEQIFFGAVTNGAANDLERVTELARSMVFEYGMGDEVASRTMRADNYALSEHAKQVRDQEQARLTDRAYQEAPRLLVKHRSSPGHPRGCAPPEGDAPS